MRTDGTVRPSGEVTNDTATPERVADPAPTAGRRAALWAGLGRIFPAPVPARITWPGVVLGILAIAAGTALALLRQPADVATDTVWAEDGSIFLTGALHDSLPRAVATSYAGYYHLVPRLLAALATLVPASMAASVLAVSAGAVTAALAVLVYAAAGGHLRSRLSRLLVAAPVLVLPLGQQELLNSIANLHWPALYALFWMLIWTPAGRIGRVVAPLTVVLVVCSDILVLGLFPLALVRVLVRRDRYSVLLAALFGTGLAVQISGLLTGSSSRALAPDPLSWAAWYVLRAVPQAMLGERLAPDGSADSRHLVLAALAWAVVAVVALVAMTRLSRPDWPLVLVAGAHSVILYALPVFLAGIATPRYAAAPAMLLVTALVAALQPGLPSTVAAGHRPPRRGSRAPLAVLAAVFLVVWGLNLRVSTPREQSPRWGAELERARTACALDGTDGVRVPIAPAQRVPTDPAWFADLPCAYLG